jgi:hypothetical protein
MRQPTLKRLRCSAKAPLCLNLPPLKVRLVTPSGHTEKIIELPDPRTLYCVVFNEAASQDGIALIAEPVVDARKGGA